MILIFRYFKYGDIPFNYGALPQTFESPDDVHPDTKLPGTVQCVRMYTSVDRIVNALRVLTELLNS